MCFRCFLEGTSVWNSQAGGIWTLETGVSVVIILTLYPFILTVFNFTVTVFIFKFKLFIFSDWPVFNYPPKVTIYTLRYWLFILSKSLWINILKYKLFISTYMRCLWHQVIIVQMQRYWVFISFILIVYALIWWSLISKYNGSSNPRRANICFMTNEKEDIRKHYVLLKGNSVYVYWSAQF